MKATTTRCIVAMVLTVMARTTWAADTDEADATAALVELIPNGDFESCEGDQPAGWKPISYAEKHKTDTRQVVDAGLGMAGHIARIATEGSRANIGYQSAVIPLPENTRALVFSCYAKIDATGETSAPDLRHAMVFDDVEHLGIDGLDATFSPGGAPMLSLIQTCGAIIRGCQPRMKDGTFLKLTGDCSRNISLIANDLSGVGKPADVAADVPKDALSVK